jgi:adenylosuccinate synthase
MPAIAVIGGQWGDEGKGKIVDFMAQDADIVVRYAGGGNAGHSVENENGKFALRTIPVGMVNSYTRLNIIGRGAVPELGIVVKELMALEERGMDITRIRIDEAAHLVMPWHIAQDRLEEEKKRKNKHSIGTTGNGIGPCYADKIRRVGFRAGDLLNFSAFYENFRQRFRERAAYLKRNYRPHFRRCSSCDICEVMRDELTVSCQLDDNIAYLVGKFGAFVGDFDSSLRERLRKMILDTRPILWNALDRGEKVLFEGAQGFLLDIDHGTYPYVTSSNTGVASAANGSGVAISDITERIAVIKAYVSRVGEGEFPTRMAGYPEQKIRELAHEYGTVTGRPRRCGWFDTVSFSCVARANGLTSVAITRLDILDHVKLIGMGVPDGKGGARIEWFQGWGPDESVKNSRTWESLPERAKEYCQIIACGYPIKYISVGPSREETIVL